MFTIAWQKESKLLSYINNNDDSWNLITYNLWYLAKCQIPSLSAVFLRSAFANLLSFVYTEIIQKEHNLQFENGSFWETVYSHDNDWSIYPHNFPILLFSTFITNCSFRIEETACALFFLSSADKHIWTSSNM